MQYLNVIDSNLRKGIRFASEKSVPATMKIMGLAMLFYAMITVFVSIKNKDAKNFETSVWTIFIGASALTLCSFFIMVDFSYNINRTIGLYALGIGVNRCFKYFLSLFTPGSSIVSEFLFVVALVMVVTSLNLCYTGVQFLKGSSRSRISMSLTAMFMLFVNIVLIAVALQTGTSLSDLFTAMPDVIAIMPLFLLLICMLGVEKIRLSNDAEYHLSILNGIRRSTVAADNSFIDRETAKILSIAMTDRSGWTKCEDKGPVEEEFTFNLVHRKKDESTVIVQKWKDCDELFFTMTDDSTGSIVNAGRFKAAAIETDGPVETCEHLYIKNGNSVIQLCVHDIYVDMWGVKYVRRT